MGESSRLFAGVSKKKLVFEADLERYTGFNGHFYGIAEDVYVRTLVLSNGTDKLVVSVPDLINTPSYKRLVKRLSEKYGMPESRFFLCGTQNHHTLCADDETAGGVGYNDPLMAELCDHLQAVIEESIDEAMNNLVPAKLGYGQGTSYCNYNRDLKTPAGTIEGIDFHGFSDHALGILRVDTADGKPLALFTSFGAQNVVLSSGAADTLSSPDFGGAVMDWTERALGGAVCLWAIGAAGDQNALINTHVRYPVPDGNGNFTIAEKTIDTASSFVLRDLFASLHGLDILNVYNSITTFTDNFSLRTGTQNVAVPGRTFEPGFHGLGEREGDVKHRLHLAVVNEDITFLGADSIVASRLGRLVKDAVSPRAFFCGLEGGLTGYTYDSQANPEGFGGRASRGLDPWYTERTFIEAFKKLALTAK